MAQIDAPEGPHSRLNRPWSRRDRPVPRSVVQPLQAFLSTEAAGGLVVLAAALVALVWANSPLADSYQALWSTEVTLDVGGFVLSEDLRHWVNDLLMALFFFVVGLEVKREFVHGALRDIRAAALPVVAALGGMVVPAGLYLLVTAGGEGGRGWGIPMATDIAFALGALALLGSRAPASLKVFLLALAVIDDIGAILVIATVYSQGISLPWLGIACVAIAAIISAQRLGIRASAPYALGAGLLWLALFSSGVHATLAGVALGLLTPALPFQQPEAVSADARTHLDRVLAQPADGRADEDEQSTLLHVQQLVGESVSPLERLERMLHPWSSYVVLPLFALANAGIAIDLSTLASVFSEAIAAGVIVGLVAGKPLGIVGAALLANRFARLPLPDDVSWPQLVGAGLLAGIGFTVSIFVAGLAFTGPQADAAILGVLVASLLAGLLGATTLAFPRHAPAPPSETKDAGSSNAGMHP